MTFLDDAHLFQVTGVIPPEFARKFAVEYLDIDGNEYKIIEHDKNYSHQETLFEVLDRWRTKINDEGKDGRRQLYQILKTIQKTKGWFSRQDIEFLTDRGESETGNESLLLSSRAIPFKK